MALITHGIGFNISPTSEHTVMYQSIPSLTIPPPHPGKDPENFWKGQIPHPPHPPGTKKVRNPHPWGRKIVLKPTPLAIIFKVPAKKTT